MAAKKVVTIDPEIKINKTSQIDESLTNNETDYTLGLPRPYPQHLKLLKNLREAERRHVDPERFRYAVDIAESKILTEPEAVIALHILEVRNISLRVTSFNTEVPMCFYCLVQIGNTRRLTNVVISDNKDRVRLDSVVHFTTTVSHYRDSQSNKLRIELWAFQDPQVHYIISTKDIHLYQLILEIHGIHKTTMWSEGLRAAKLIYEFAFSYGAFGYGHSNQLKNTECTIFEAVANSLFPRLANSPKDVTESCFNIRVPKKLHILSQSSFIFEQSKDNDQSTNAQNKSKSNMKRAEISQPRSFTAHAVEFQNGVPVHCKINTNIYQKEFESEFNNIYGQYLCLTRRRDRLEFLHGLMEGRLDDLQESSSVGSMFANLEEGILENIIDNKEQNLHHQIVYPLSRPCTAYPQAELTREDEEYLNKFPSLTRTTGWLGRLFGYSPLYRDPHFLQPEIELDKSYLPNPDVEEPWFKNKEGTCNWLWRMIRIGLNFIYVCLFPELRRQHEIPEICLTLPTPQGSTTDLYVRWFEEEDEEVLEKAKERLSRELHEAGQPSKSPAEQFEIDEMGDEVLHDEVERELAILHHMTRSGHHQHHEQQHNIL